MYVDLGLQWVDRVFDASSLSKYSAGRAGMSALPELSLTL